MLLLVVFIPLFSAFICGFFGRFLGQTGTRIFSTISLIFNFFIACRIFLQLGSSTNNITVNLGNWISSGLFVVEWSFIIDDLTIVMLLVVNLISCLVHFYSTSYMAEDPHLPRFMSYLSLFTFFMLILISADNYIQLFLGWEGVGLCSYLLISFWYTRIQANKSALKAIIVNRISDFCLTIGIIIIYYFFRSVDFSISFALAPFFIDKMIYLNFFGDVYILNIIALLLYIGAVGKSAQILLHTWLPDAMEGPTPVSALIHAATMVTAGVFLVIKCSPIMEYSSTALLIIGFSGGITALFAASSGLMQYDIKKVIAYSTCSQLGYMMLACGLSAYNVSLFHLMNHAVFKALLFLCAGAVIHSVGNEQDMRKMGGLVKLLPLTYSMMLIGTLAITGFPYLTGYFSKDVILETAFGAYGMTGNFIHWLASITAFFTAFYSFRLLYLVFFAPINVSRSVASNIHESPILMTLPLIILSFSSIFVGYFFKDLMIGTGNLFLSNTILLKIKTIYIYDSEFISTLIKLIPLYMGILGLVVFIQVLKLWRKSVFFYSVFWNNILKFFANKWYFDVLYNKYINIPILYNAYNWTYKLLDKGLLEFFGPFGFWLGLKRIGLFLNSLQTGKLGDYLFFMFFFVIIYFYIMLCL
jgi:NADH-ubiquinone oxidoreductase chain 5